MPRVTITVKNMDKLIALAAKYPAVSEKHVGMAINRSLVRVFGEIKRVAPFGVSGNLRDRWSVIMARFAGVLRSGVHYASDVEMGTSPHYVSPASLAPWARKKGLNEYAVSKSIAKKGTKANPFLQRSVDGTAKAIAAEFTAAINATLAEVT